MLRERMSYQRRFHPLKVLFFALVAIAFVAAISWVVMALWNYVLVNAISVKPINFWQAAGLLILSKILFGFGFGSRGRWRGKRRHRASHWKDKWMHMSEEERKEFKAKWREKCGYK